MPRERAKPPMQGHDCFGPAGCERLCCRPIIRASSRPASALSDDPLICAGMRGRQCCRASAFRIHGWRRGAPTAASPVTGARFDGVEIVPRYGVTTALPPRRRRAVSVGATSAPDRRRAHGRSPRSCGPAPTGTSAAAAQARACVPYVLGLVGGMTRRAGGRDRARRCLWFQPLSLLAQRTTPSGFDLVRRAQAAGRACPRAHGRRAGAHQPAPREVAAGHLLRRFGRICPCSRVY